jgi:hypothetical protein
VIALLVTTCGREHYLNRMLVSLPADVALGEHGPRIIVDDSGDDDFSQRLRDRLPGWHIISHAERCGLAAAIESGWDAIRKLNVDHVLHIEDDFVFPEGIPLDTMVDTLEADDTLAQVVLYRQPWSPGERVAGGYLNDGKWSDAVGGLHYGSHLFSFNPCLYPSWVCDHPGGLEADVTLALLAEHKRFAVLTGPDQSPLCFHIGAERSAGW